MSAEHSVSHVTEHVREERGGHVTEHVRDESGGHVTEHVRDESGGHVTEHVRDESGGHVTEHVRDESGGHITEHERHESNQVRAYRGFLRLLGFPPRKYTAPDTADLSPARHSLSGRKRLHPVTRLLLSVLPRWAQSALGFPVSSSIGRSLSPEVRSSPTKPCGKGSKRKQDELDEDEEEQPTWVEALTQELSDRDNPEEDPDYEPSTIETESEEYRSQNDTESDLDVPGKGLVVVEDLDTVELVPV